MKKLILLFLLLSPAIVWAQSNKQYIIDSTGIQGKVILHQSTLEEVQAAFPGGHYDYDYSGENLWPPEYRDIAKGYQIIFSNDNTVKAILLQHPFKASGGPDLVIGETSLSQFKQKHPEALIVKKTDRYSDYEHATYTNGNIEFTFIDIDGKKYNEATMKLFAVMIK